MGGRLLLLLATLGAAGLASAQGAGPAASAAGIYTCTDDNGRRLTSDRPIPACVGKEQRELNRDGSLRRIVPPTLSAEERAEREATERRMALVRAAQADAVRRDRNLVARFPDEAAHRKAREAALDTVRVAMKTTEQRKLELAAERKPLNEEAEFYKGKNLPAKLRQQIDANDAAVDAQRDAVSNQEAELVRINKLYDEELARLRKLWGGAQPGSLPVAAPAAAVSRAAASAAR
ncbi:DUF4124 domain-containing protein [Aquincola sp. S2]|uniref:DUF4124 domain-containing protein n=1 Tax=Pseudaquabacterium terrae TaxID=2732868 RepID=A0ABX2EKJ5_9BURK|nr:DUF4124 domain-containing protein [Aquabacterium terrae]NRF69177.1 DUF4124 domain-containing protein [Aquabacterium terrae]